MHEYKRLLDNFENLSSWAAVNATKESDPVNFVTGKRGLKVTQTGGTTARIDKTANNGVLIGKYIRLWFNVHDVGKVNSVIIIIWTGSSYSNYYALDLSKSNGRLIDGIQQLDVHLDDFTKTGTPQNSNQIYAISLQITSVAGQLGSVTFDRLESVYRKPYIIFVNDGARKEYIEDILPLLMTRGLPNHVQIMDTLVTNYLASPETPNDNQVPLSKLQNLIGNDYLIPGLHMNCQQATDAEFYNYLREHMRVQYELGIWKGAPSLTSLQSNWGHINRRNHTRAFCPFLRRGTNASQPTVAREGGKMHGILPVASTQACDIPAADFTADTTAEAASGWITTAIEKELGLYVFGHGSDRFQASSRSPLSVYQAFFETYDMYSDKIDWITIDEWLNRYRHSRPGLNTTLTAYTYAP